MKRYVLALLLCCTLLFNGCGAWNFLAEPVSLEENVYTDSQQGVTTVRILLSGEAAGLDRVLEVVRPQLCAELGLDIDITFLPAEGYAQALMLKLYAREDWDLVFDAPWILLNAMVDAGYYTDLTDYFHSEAYPGLEAAFSQEYLTANRFNSRTYAVPITNAYHDPLGIYYRRDVLEELDLGFDLIASWEQLQAFYDALLLRTGYTPLSLGRRGFFSMHADTMYLKSRNVFEVEGWSFSDYPTMIVLDETGTQVQDVVFFGDEEERFAPFGDGLQYNFLDAFLLANAEWSRYVQEDSIFSTDGIAPFMAGESASFESPVSNNTVLVQATLRERTGGGDVEFFAYDWIYQNSNWETEKIPTTMKAWNYLCVPSYSTKADEAMRFLDWLFGERSRLELFNYGIEGEDWVAVGENEYTYLENPAGNYLFPGYTMVWSPLYNRIQTGTSDHKRWVQEYAFDTENYSTSALAGWALNTSRISVEMAQLNALYAEHYLALAHGHYGPRTGEIIGEIHLQSLEMGLETVREEIRRQAQNYLDSQNIRK